ncbi:MAG: SDR family oxidoreductase [Pseudomonadota bacterium]
MSQIVRGALFDLSGQVALITGATGGLGRAFASVFVAYGASVVLADREQGDCEALAMDLAVNLTPAQTIFCCGGDLARSDECQRLIDAALARYGRIDTLVLNAGMQGPAGPLTTVSDDDWDAVMALNLKSAWCLSSAALPAMARQGGGSVVLMSSIAGLRGNGAIGLYGVSKAALAQMARNLAVEWGPKGVRVNSISPGLINTPFAQGLITDPVFMVRRLAATPLRRVGEPEEVAGVALMLASRAGAFITGQNLIVDGGTLVSDGS